MSTTTGKPQRSKWFALVWAVPLAIVLLAAVVLPLAVAGIPYLAATSQETRRIEASGIHAAAYLGWPSVRRAL